MNNQAHSIIGDGGGPYKTLKGAINVHHADVHNIVVNDYVHRHGNATVLTAAVNKGDKIIEVDDATGFVVGKFVHLGDTANTIEPIHPQITAVAAKVITLDRPLDNDFAIGEAATISIIDLNDITGTVAGTLAVPVVYRYLPALGRIEHIDRIMISMTHSTAGDDSTFGDLAALLNGVVFRAQVNGIIGTFTNWKSNRDFILDMFDVVYTDKAGPGVFGTRARGAFSELDVSIALDGSNGDFLEILVQDDLTALTSFRIKAQGHVEGA